MQPNDEGDFGHWDETRQTIWLNEELEGDQLLQAFIHEGIHVVESAIGIKLKHRQLDAAAGIITQMIKTAQGELKRASID